MGDTGSHDVELYIYDLTSGMAAMMSQLLLGRHIDGIWHTAVVVYGREFFFGGQGIQSCPPVSQFAVATFHCLILNIDGNRMLIELMMMMLLLVTSDVRKTTNE